MKNVDTKEEMKKREMKIYNRIVKWNYKTAWKFFTEEAYMRYIPETEIYIKSLPVTETLDLRDNPKSGEILLEAIKPSSLLIVDGGSSNGKTTFAFELAKKVDGTVVDIDLLCKDWIEEHLKNAKSQLELFYIKYNADSLTDAYLLDNLEGIIHKKSLSKKPVILVVYYKELIYRSILARTLGKYFDEVISLVCCEKDFKQVKKFIKKRQQEYGPGIPNEIEMSFQQWNLVNEFINCQNGFFLGIGMDKSFVIDSKVTDKLK